MSEPPAGWSSPSGEPEPPSGAAPAPGAPGYAAPQPGYGPPPGYAAPPGYGPPPGYGAPPPYGAPPGIPPQYAGPPGAWYGGPPPTPQPGVVPLRPLTVGELLDGAVKVIRRYPKPTLGLSAAVALVTTLLNLVAILFMDFSGDVEAITDDTGDDVTFNSMNLASIPGLLVSLPAGVFLTGALVAVVGRAVLGQEAALGEVWQQLKPRLWALLGLTLLTGLLVGAPALLVALVALLVWAAGGGGTGAGVTALFLVLPALAAMAYLWVRLSLAPAVLVLERSGVRTALRRSGELVRGSWWRLFGLLLLAQVVASLVAQVLVMPVGIVGAFTALDQPTDQGLAVFTAVLQVASGLADMLVTPFVAGVGALLYIDRRMRAEALDLTLQAAARA